nr:hypothetical protein [Tanacetum cinerariifolium]
SWAVLIDFDFLPRFEAVHTGGDHTLAALDARHNEGVIVTADDVDGVRRDCLVLHVYDPDLGLAVDLLQHVRRQFDARLDC